MDDVAVGRKASHPIARSHPCRRTMWPWAAVPRRLRERDVRGEVEAEPPSPPPLREGGGASTTKEDMFTAASDTTGSLLEWAMAELINHPDEMHKLQEEIRMAIHVGGENQVTEDHLGMLRHLKSVLKETLRLHTPAPLVRRETVEDTELLGYHLPVGTRVLIDIGVISQDPTKWERAEEFVPERWLRDDRAAVADNYATAGNDFTFLPFGGGRRRCPGVGYGMANAELVLASLLYHFDWELPIGGPSTVDMDEVIGMVVRLKKPLCLFAKPWSP